MEFTYKRILSWIRQTKKRELYITLFCKYLPFTTGVCYISLLGYLVATKNDLFWQSIYIPASTFLTVTLFRKIFNRPRPYEALDIDPLFQHKNGESFPSRHSASAFAIAIAGYIVSPILGYVLFSIATLVAMTRFFAGVHYISDIVVAIGIAFLINWGYYVLSY